MTNLVQKKAVKEKVQSLNPEFRVGGDFYDEYESKAEQLLVDAYERALANDRKTVYAKDL